MPQVTVFEVPAPTASVPHPDPVKHDGFSVAADGDAAKRAAKEALIGEGWKVRSINWAPDVSPGKPAMLVAYVTKETP